MLEVWTKTIGQARGIKPVFVGVRTQAGKPALFIPFGIQRDRGSRVLRFLDGGVSDYNAPVVFPAASELSDAQQFWKALKRQMPRFDVAILEKMPEAVEDLPNPLFALATQTRRESCHAVRLYGPWEKFARERISHLSDSRRRRRKVEKLGNVRFHIAENAEERERFLDAMMRMKRRKFIETKGYDVFTDPGLGNFYRQTTCLLGENGPVQLSALSLDDRILATHWGYVEGDRFYHLMPGHEVGEWRPFAPGRLLNEWLIQWCIDRGLKYLDFGIGDEPYKFDYCDQHIPLRDAFLPASQLGRLFAAAHRIELAAKHVLRDTPLGTALMDMRKRWKSGKSLRGVLWPVG